MNNPALGIKNNEEIIASNPEVITKGIKGAIRILAISEPNVGALPNLIMIGNTKTLHNKLAINPSMSQLGLNIFLI